MRHRQATMTYWSFWPARYQRLMGEVGPLRWIAGAELARCAA